MDGPKKSMETQAVSTSMDVKNAPQAVFQPPQLKQIVEVIDLMGTVASRIREDNSGDLPAFGGSGAQTHRQSGVSSRDEAIANAPPLPDMQKALVFHLEREVKKLQEQAKSLSRSNKRGSAFLLNNMYRKIRRLSALIAEILQASAEMIKRFYISVFIDQQPLVVRGGSIVQSEE